MIQPFVNFFISYKCFHNYQVDNIVAEFNDVDQFRVQDQ